TRPRPPSAYQGLKSWVTLPKTKPRLRGAAPGPSAGRERRDLPMKQPGRVSADAASVVVPPEAALPNARLDPPPALGEREAVEWRAITTGLGAAWFPRECHALLTAYCVTKTQLDDVHQALRVFGPSLPEDEQGWRRYRELTALRNRLVRELM